MRRSGGGECRPLYLQRLPPEFLEVCALGGSALSGLLLLEAAKSVARRVLRGRSESELPPFLPPRDFQSRREHPALPV